MKKLKFIACLAVLSAIGVSYYGFVPSKHSESDIFMANVEALTAGEGGSSTSWPCWSNVKSGDGVWICGNPCSFDRESNGRGSADSSCEKQ